MKIGKVKKSLGMWKIIVAAVFLFNPNFVIVDFLPDFIGYIFLLLGISQLSDLNYHFQEAANGFKKLIIVSLVQTLSILFVFGVLTQGEQESALTLFCFTFGVLDVVFLLPAFKAFFEGFIYLGSRHESTAIFKVKERKASKSDDTIVRAELSNDTESMSVSPEIHQKKSHKPKKEKAPKRKRPPLPRKNATEKVLRFTVLFIVLKPALTFAPEILGLIESPYYINYARFVDSFRSLAWMILVPLGLIWLFRFVSYIGSIIKDKPFINELKDKYTSEITPKTFLFTQRYVKLAFAFLSVAIAFNIDFYIDHSSIIPDFISPAIIFIMLLVVRRINKVPIISYIATAGYLASSIVTYAMNISFFNEHTLSKTYFIPEAYEAFETLTKIKIADSVLFVLMVISILPVLSRIIRENTGFAPISAGNYSVEEKRKYIHSLLKKRLIIAAVLAVFAGASSIAYAMLVRFTEREKWLLYIWVVEFIIYLIFTVYFISTLNEISEEMEHKYMLE